MDVNYETLLNDVKKVMEIDPKAENIEGTAKISDLEEIIGYCRISEIYLMEKIKSKIEKKLFKGEFFPCKFGSFDYDPKTQEMKLVLNYYMGKEEVYEMKRLDNGDVVVTSTTHKEGVSKMLMLIGAYIDEMCEYKEQTLDYNTLDARGIKGSNGKFLISMDKTGVTVHRPGFKISTEYEWNNCPIYKIYCDSLGVNQTLKNKEEEFFKRLRVKINDCPEWMHDELKHRNKKEIAKREAKKNSLVNKLFKK